jgi:hypothetical protein
MRDRRTSLLAILELALAASLVLCGCSDYDVWSDDDDLPPDGLGGHGEADDDDDDDDGAPHDDDTDDGDDDDTGLGDDDMGTGDDDTGVGDDDAGVDDDDADADDDDGEDDDCPGGVTTTVTDSDGDGWVVITTSDPEDWAIVHVPMDGVYEIYDTQLSESGASQMNESAYITVSNSVNAVGLPVAANCDSRWIVGDTANNGTPVDPIYVGTFSMMAGEDNLLTLHHYCPLYQNGQCPSFHNGDPNTGSGCNTNDANSVHMDLDGICIIPW